MRRGSAALSVSMGLMLVLASCGGGKSATIPRITEPTAVPLAQDCASSTTDQTVCMPASSLNLSALPLGTGKASTAPKQGYIWACRVPSGGPPVSPVPWVNTTAGTWSAKTKVAVEGSVKWSPKFTATQQGSELVLSGNGLPARSGVFPVSESDPAHAYNPDPTPITAHSIKVTLAANPTAAASPTCVGGVVGIAVNGIPLLDGFDADGNDAGAVEVQDTCHGHPNDHDGYHYHSLSPCLLSKKSLTHTTQVGWALDGFGIYVEYNSSGQLLTNADLDACHGRTSKVPWHGKTVSLYHYDMTFEFPYSVGCFSGTPSTAASGL